MPKDDAMPGADNEAPNAETVTELLRNVERLLGDERTRGQGLDVKTSSLAGFSGAILALTATLGGTLLRSGDLGDLELATRVCFLLAVLALSSAATLAVGGVLRPQRRIALSVDQLREFSERPLISAPKLDVEGRMMVTLIESLAVERETNRRKAFLTQLVAVFLVVGFLAVGAMAVTIGVR